MTTQLTRKQLIDSIYKKGTDIYQILKSINEQNKIVRAKALAEKYTERINILIIQAKELGLEDSVSKLEQSKANLLSANSTSQIKQNIKLVIVQNTLITKLKVESMEDVKRSEIQLSKQQQAYLQLGQLETKVDVLSGNSEGNNIAIYYLDKVEMLIESVKIKLKDPSNDVSKNIKQIERLLLKVEKMLQDTT